MGNMYGPYDCGCCPCCGCTCDDWDDERGDEKEDDFIAPTYTVAADYDPIEGVFYEVEPDKLPPFDCGGESMTYEMVDGINTHFDARRAAPDRLEICDRCGEGYSCHCVDHSDPIRRAWASLKAILRF